MNISSIVMFGVLNVVPKVAIVQIENMVSVRKLWLLIFGTKESCLSINEKVRWKKCVYF